MVWVNKKVVSLFVKACFFMHINQMAVSVCLSCEPGNMAKLSEKQEQPLFSNLSQISFADKNLDAEKNCT